MSSMNIDECFKAFNLPTTATLSQLDDRYYQYMTSVVASRSRKKELDQAYAALLHHFVSKLSASSLLDDSPPAKNSLRDLTTKAQDGAIQRGLGRDSTGASDLEEEIEEKHDNIVPSIENALDIAIGLHLSEESGDIFDVPDRSVIVHAVNCLGTWGNGFAFMMRRHVPHAFAAYLSVCLSAKSPTSLAGTCLLIPPHYNDFRRDDKTYPRRWVACLFTSVGYGKTVRDSVNPGKGDVATILRHTDKALMDLRRDLAAAHQDPMKPLVGDLYSPKINSGLFGVPWEDTKQLIERSFASYQGSWTVVTFP